MTKLEDLLYSLTTALVRYHDSQSNVKKCVNTTDQVLLRKHSRQFAIGIFNDKDTSYEDSLSSIANAIVEHYNEKGHFLAYLIHEIKFLKSLNERKNPLLPDEVEMCVNQIALLITDLRTLLNSLKETPFAVTYNQSDNLSDTNTKVSIAGMSLSAYFGGTSYTRSGGIIKEEVFDTLNINTNPKIDSDDEIRILASSICNEFQNALLVKSIRIENQSLKKQLKANDSELIELRAARHLLKAKVDEHEATIADLKLESSAKTMGFTFHPAFFQGRLGNRQLQSNSSSASESPSLESYTQDKY